ncbi:MAG: type transport system ATP-binding protein [Frankiaceae bacterium]|nr:type transport system ATP-binding protein [Frankiaceae bacterium]
MNRPLAIEMCGVVKSYKGIRVLDGIELAVKSGSVFALLGPNGAGKTTLVRILATLSTADAGSVRVAGLDVVRNRRQVRQLVSLTGQFAAVDEPLTGDENLRMVGRLAGLSSTEASTRASQLLGEFDLVDAGARRVSTYSGGMRRKLDLAASLVVQPSVLFLDEPTTGLDPRSRQQMYAVVRALVAEGVTVFLTTQYLEEADQLADQIALIDAGRIVAQGAPAELKSRVADQVLSLTMRSAGALADAVAVLGSRASPMPGLCVEVATDGSARDVRALLDTVDPGGLGLEAFTIRSATLDDVFLALTGRASAPALEEALHV